SGTFCKGCLRTVHLTYGGEGGIRTHGGVSPTLAFEASTFNRSVPSPRSAFSILKEMKYTQQFTFSVCDFEMTPAEHCMRSTGIRHATWRGRKSAAGGEKSLEKRSGFFGQDTRDKFDAVIQKRVREHFKAGAGGAAAWIGRTINEFCDACLNHGARTHRARLEGDVKGSAGQAIVVEYVRSFTNYDDFGVSRGVVITNGAIARTRDDFFFIN